jgi:hypothetical protein
MYVPRNEYYFTLGPAGVHGHVEEGQNIFRRLRGAGVSRLDLSQSRPRATARSTRLGRHWKIGLAERTHETSAIGSVWLGDHPSSRRALAPLIR